MTFVSLFIASSYDAAHERAVIGDAVRRLNDKYEPQGFRVKLHCWEDYEPEYRGLRKQSEYNEDLVKTSDIFIALFRENCGRFTQEEIGVWTNELHKPPVVFDIDDSTADKTAVHDYLTANSFSPVTVSCDEDIYSEVETLVAHFIADSAVSTSGVLEIDAKEIYATIPDDRTSERAPFGNLVRCVDDFAERTFHSRCRLYMCDANRIASSIDYYIGILKDRVSPAEEAEVLTAIESSKTTKKPFVQLYYNHDNNVCANHPQINTAINSCGIFNEAFDSFHRIKFNLVRWLHQQNILAVELNAGIDIQDGWFIFFKMPVVPLSVLGINGGTVAHQLAELLKMFSLAVLGVNAQVTSSTGEVDLKALDAQMNRVSIFSDAIQDVENEILNRREQWLKQVSDNINSLLSGQITDANIGRLTDLIERKELLQIALSVDPKELLRTQMLMVQVSDTYPQQFKTTGRDADAQYLKVAQTADSYGIKDPTVEMMRMNYANYLYRHNLNSEALAYYETAMSNFGEFDDRSELMRHYIVHLYVTYINFVSALGENHRAIDAINILTNKETTWEKEGLSLAEAIANQCQILACQLRIRPIEGNVVELLNRAMDTYQKALAIPVENYDSSILTDVFCHLPNCIASTVMDAIQEGVELSMETAQHNVITCLNNVISCARRYADEQTCLTYLGNAYHNLGFFYSNTVGDQLTARNYCKEALSVREKIVSEMHQPNDLYDVAQTLLLLGATYVNDRHSPFMPAELDEALGYADRCVRLYTDLNQEHYLEQETRVHQAIQLKGSILYIGGRKEEGIALLKQAWDWNLANPGNNYESVFRGVAGEILKREGMIR